jgi:ribosomal protein S18 acetylase RimI-like enzyme
MARIHNAAYRSDADFRRFTAEEMADYLAGDGGCPAALNVSSKNFRARALYERLGFKAAREKLRFSALRSDLVAAMAERNK